MSAVGNYTWNETAFRGYEAIRNIALYDGQRGDECINKRGSVSTRRSCPQTFAPNKIRLSSIQDVGLSSFSSHQRRRHFVHPRFLLPRNRYSISPARGTGKSVPPSDGLFIEIHHSFTDCGVGQQNARKIPVHASRLPAPFYAELWPRHVLISLGDAVWKATDVMISESRAEEISWVYVAGIQSNSERGTPFDTE
jgi:hypothetical protein